MVLALGPVGCGFQPIYARSGGAASSPMADQLASVRIAAIPDRQGQLLRNNLVSSLSPRGEPASPAYVLDVNLTESSSGFASSKDGTATVGKLSISATYSLRETAGGRVVHHGRTRAISGYRFVGPRYGSTVSEREAQLDALMEIAAEIRGALSAYFTTPETFHQRAERSQAIPAVVSPRQDPPFAESE